MTALTPDIIVQILGGNTMTARRRPKREAHSAWISVVSLERPQLAYLNSTDLDGRCSLRVRTFEIADVELKYEDVDDSVILDSERFSPNSFRELQALIDRLEVDASTLTFKANSGYPL